MVRVAFQRQRQPGLMNFLHVLFHLKWSYSPLKNKPTIIDIAICSSLERIIAVSFLNDQICSKKYHSYSPKIGGIYDERCANPQLYETGGVERSEKVQDIC